MFAFVPAQAAAAVLGAVTDAPVFVVEKHTLGKTKGEFHRCGAGWRPAPRWSACGAFLPTFMRELGGGTRAHASPLGSRGKNCRRSEVSWTSLDKDDQI